MGVRLPSSSRMGTRSSAPERRKTSDSAASSYKGLPRYDDAAESDVFLLSGAEDLVPILDDDGKRTPIEDVAAGEIVQRYRPRTEGGFARIERRERTLDG